VPFIVIIGEIYPNLIDDHQSSRALRHEALRGACMALSSNATDCTAMYMIVSLQVESGQSIADLVPLYITQLSDGSQSVNIFVDAAMSTPLSSKTFQELGCKHGDM
jgi:hypothetical protein